MLPVCYNIATSSCIIVFSFVQVKNWVKELRKMLDDKITLCIAGNKTDMEKERHVTVEEAEEYVQ